VFVVREDVEDRGIDEKSCIGNIRMIARGDIAKVFEQHDQVWHW